LIWNFSQIWKKIIKLKRILLVIHQNQKHRGFKAANNLNRLKLQKHHIVAARTSKTSILENQKMLWLSKYLNRKWIKEIRLGPRCLKTGIWIIYNLWMRPQIFKEDWKKNQLQILWFYNRFIKVKRILPLSKETRNRNKSYSWIW
jgi:hypothetical protein